MSERYSAQFLIFLTLSLCLIFWIKVMEIHIIQADLIPGIFFTEDAHIDSIVIKRGNSPRYIDQGDQSTGVNCRFLPTARFEDNADLFPSRYRQSAKLLLAGHRTATEAIFCESDETFISENDFSLHADFPVDYVYCRNMDCTSSQSLALYLLTPSQDKNQAQSMILMLRSFD